MHLVAPLAAGVSGADNGIARIYRRGTSTRATVFYDFEASTADSSGDDIPLDSEGGVVVYVNELVEVRVYSNLGELLRDFVAGDQAYAIEAISPAFTGTDYESGARRVSKPANLGAILDLWLTSAGAIDWEVLFNGAATPLQDALGSIYGLFFNVKSPEFGAVGDGAADDTAAFVAAHEAARAASSGIVVVPPGTYNISTVIPWYLGVHLLCMPGRVNIRQLSTSTSHFAITNAVAHATILAGPDTYFIGAVLDSTVTNLATQITVSHGTAGGLVIDSFQFLASSFCTGSAFDVSSATGRVQIRNSSATGQAARRIIVDTRTPSAGAMMAVDNCVVTTFAGASLVTDPMIRSSGNELRVTRTRFVYTATSGAALAIYLAGATYPLTVSDCQFVPVSGGSSRYAVQVFAAMTARVGDSNHFPASTSLTRYYQAAVTDIANGLSYLTLQQSIDFTTSTPGIDLSGVQARSVMLTSNYAAAAPTVTMPSFYYYGQPLALAVFNNSGSLWGTSMGITDWAGAGTAYDTVAAAVGLDNTYSVSVNFVAVSRDGSPQWMEMGGFSARLS